MAINRHAAAHGPDCECRAYEVEEVIAERDTGREIERRWTLSICPECGARYIWLYDVGMITPAPAHCQEGHRSAAMELVEVMPVSDHQAALRAEREKWEAVEGRREAAQREWDFQCSVSEGLLARAHRAEQQLAEAREALGEMARDGFDLPLSFRGDPVGHYTHLAREVLKRLSPSQEPEPSSAQGERCGGSGKFEEFTELEDQDTPCVDVYECPGCIDCEDQPATDSVRGRPETGWTCKGSGQFSYPHLIQLSGPAVGGPFPCPGCPDCRGTGEKPKGER